MLKDGIAKAEAPQFCWATVRTKAHDGDGDITNRGGDGGSTTGCCVWPEEGSAGGGECADSAGAGAGAEGHPDHREGAEADSRCDGEGERLAGAGWSKGWDSGRGLLGVELQH